ncbi:hypothetical protein EV424DRAFT_1347028 [Suillus variegatus]|nr:hypothetical protein EV424DRAFT_1347028 [Suillus variegatus]
MPPKKATKVPKLGRKKAKVGAIFSGISRAAPSNVNVGSMINLINDPSASLNVSKLLANNKTLLHNSNIMKPAPLVAVQTQAMDSSSPAITMATICHFCCDQTSAPHKHKCINCGAIVCEKFTTHSSRCIVSKFVEVPESEFRYPMYSRMGHGRDKSLCYAFIGFGKQKKAKMVWPMTIVNLNLESMKDNYLANTVILEAQNHYRGFQSNASGAHLSKLKKLAPGIDFISHNIEAGSPPNVFLIMDIHSDKFSDMLQHTRGHMSGTSTSLTKILTVYLGEEFLRVMQQSSRIARSDKKVMKTINGNKPWCNLTACAQGGWRGVIMVSCGPAIRVSHHFKAVKVLVEINIVDFVVGFGGLGMLPSMISNAVQSIIMEIGVFGHTNIWSTISRISQKHTPLDMSLNPVPPQSVSLYQPSKKQMKQKEIEHVHSVKRTKTHRTVGLRWHQFNTY